MGGKFTKVKKGALLLWEENNIYIFKRCSVSVGGKYTKLKEGALLLWEKNIQNFKMVLCYCGRKIHKT